MREKERFFSEYDEGVAIIKKKGSKNILTSYLAILRKSTRNNIHYNVCLHFTHKNIHKNTRRERERERNTETLTPGGW